jgi:hypothetical protein
MSDTFSHILGRAERALNSLYDGQPPLNRESINSDHQKEPLLSARLTISQLPTTPRRPSLC